MHQHLQATGTHTSLSAHITQRELAQNLHRTEAHNGFANRCLWAWVQRSNCLPEASAPTSYPPSPASSVALSTGLALLPKSSFAAMQRRASSGRIAIPP
jgi:hypothetical protein